MKIRELTRIQQDSLIKTLSKYVYPLYAETGIDNFEYHFIGSSVLMKKENRLFFIFTRHQALQLNGGNLCISYPQEKNKFIRFSNAEIKKFEESDLAICECNDRCPNELTAIDSSLALPPIPSLLNEEVMIIGYPVEINTVDHDNNKIIAESIAIITEDIDLKDGFDSIDIGLNSYLLGSYPDHNKNLQSHSNLTQGLSGSPIFAFNIIETNQQQGRVDINMVGIATHTNESEKLLCATRTQELIACLHIGFKAYPELDKINPKL